jgi:archaetidylinositol phosphate synthase
MACDRELTGFISRHEKPILIYLAQRIPAGIHPDHMTAIGIAGAALSLAGCVLSYFGAGWLLLSVLGLVVNWVGDSLTARSLGCARWNVPVTASSSTT